MLTQLRRASEQITDSSDYPFRLVSRRLPDIVNSSWRPNAITQRRWPNNPAFMNPEDLQQLQLNQGDSIRLVSAHAQIDAIVESSKDVKSGVISMSHCGGASHSEADALQSNTGKLSPTDRDYDPYTGIPVMSGIPVTVEPA